MPATHGPVTPGNIFESIAMSGTLNKGDPEI